MIDLTYFFLFIFIFNYESTNIKLNMTYIKLFTSIVLCLQYKLTVDPFIYQRNLCTSFFIFDLFYIVKYIGLKKPVYNFLIYHHLSILTLLYFDLNANFSFPYYIYIGELSNIPMLVYYLFNLKNYKNKVILYFLRLVEISSYLYLRLYIFTLNFYLGNWRQFGYSLYYCIIPLYIMGLLWSFLLIKQLII